MKSHKNIISQVGQGMVEYVVVLSFFVMALTVGGGDRILDMFGVLHDNHQGYAYSASLSTLPENDNIGVLSAELTRLDNRLTEITGISPDQLISDAFPRIPSVQDILEEAAREALPF
ncbi:hypothetical protein OAB56_00840 [Gammaproteobacteria bacterium]|nr:hypothetical protein [Gammaproteobacteria bacterium]